MISYKVILLFNKFTQQVYITRYCYEYGYTSHKLMYIPCFETEEMCSRQLCDALCARPICRRTMCHTFKVYSQCTRQNVHHPAVNDVRQRRRLNTLLVSFLNLLSQQ